MTAADVRRARTEERSLLRTWVMRKTIHMIAAEDAGWMLPLFEPGIERWSRRRLGQLGLDVVTQERALETVGRALVADGPLTRAELAERVAEAGIELDTQTRLHLFVVAVTSGLACLGPDRGSQTCLVRREDWLGVPPRFDRDGALAELARRYLHAYGPATERDLAAWSGLGLNEVRSGLGAIAPELEEIRYGGETLLRLRRGAPRLPRRGQIRLLGAFDTYLLGYRSREFAVPPVHAPAVKAGGGGWIRPVVIRDGIVIGGWRSERKGGAHRVAIEVQPGLSVDELEAINAEVADIGRFEATPTEAA